MSGRAVALLLTAGALHATWNLLLKTSARRVVVIWWALLVGSALFLPALLASPVPRALWPFVAASALVECAYFLLLAYAYGQADFSQAYPLARGAAPALLAVWAALALRERPSPAGLAGLALIVAGLVPVGGGEAWWKWSGAGFRARGVAASLGVALCISVYSLIDGVAVRRTAALPYNVAITLLTALLLAPATLARHGARAALTAWRGQAARIVAAGALMLLAYTLVLRAYAVAPLAYAGAIREVGVVFAALAGWVLLREPFGVRRVAGAVSVVSGIVVLSMLG